MLVELNNTLSNGRILSLQKEDDITWQVLENDLYIWLVMNQTVQSVLTKADPNLLGFPHQMPLNGLLTELPDTPKILELGLGGGSNARFIYNQYPNSQITIVEQSETIITWFEQFFNPLNYAIKIIHGDANQTLHQTEQHYDLVITDLFYAGRSSLNMLNREYFEQLFKILNPNGKAYLNFLPETDFEPELVKAMLNNAGFNILWSDKIVGFRNWVFLLNKAAN